RTLFGPTQKFRLPLPQRTMMAWRHMLRWPVRTAMTALGTSLSVALLVTALSTLDAVDFLVTTVFNEIERQDATVQFSSDLSPEAVAAVSRMPGVLKVEGYRGTAVVLRHGHRERRLALTTIAPAADLARMLDRDLRPVEPLPTGL